MKALWLFTVFLGGTAFAQNADFTPLEKKAWKSFCESELQGDAALCSCVQTLQVKDLGAKTVKINYLSMALEMPEQDADELVQASEGLDKLVGDSDSKLEKALDAYMESLPDNVLACTG